MRLFVGLLLCMLSFTGWSKAFDFDLLVQYEGNNSDSISSIGVASLSRVNYSDVRFGMVSYINYASVTDQWQEKQNYLGWDIGARLGYYRDLYIYAEVGVDALEVLLEDLRGDDDRSYYSDEDDDFDIDAYASVGVGVQTKSLRLELFVKARKIDGSNWESEHTQFYGGQLTIPF